MFRIKLPDRDKPLPEEEIIDDRGETKYFHGRENEKKYILRLLFRSSPGKKGSCFLVQGPPGVGKTAFLAECRKWAEEKGWGTAEIRPGALWDTDILWECLGKAKRRLKRISAEVGIDITSIGVSLDLDRDASTPIKALQGKDAPLLLILDEAQRFGNPTLIPAGKQELVTSLLDYIHNGKMDRPLVLLVGGLGNTRSVFEGVLGISRFKSNCYFNLEALSRAEERGVIKDWLTEEGQGEGGHHWLGGCHHSRNTWVGASHRVLPGPCPGVLKGIRGGDDGGGVAYRHGAGAGKPQGILPWPDGRLVV